MDPFLTPISSEVIFTPPHQNQNHSNHHNHHQPSYIVDEAPPPFFNQQYPPPPTLSFSFETSLLQSTPLSTSRTLISDNFQTPSNHRDSEAQILPESNSTPSTPTQESIPTLLTTPNQEITPVNQEITPTGMHQTPPRREPRNRHPSLSPPQLSSFNSQDSFLNESIAESNDPLNTTFIDKYPHEGPVIDPLIFTLCSQIPIVESEDWMFD